MKFIKKISKIQSGFIWKYKTQIFLFFIVMLAFYARFQVAKEFSVMDDEAVLVMDSSQSFKNLFLLNYWNTAHPPVYDIIDKITVITTGTSPISIRLKSQIFGSLSLIFLFQIVFLLTQSINTSFIVVILTSFSGFFIGLSAFNRPYGFQQFFVLGFLYYFLKIFLKKSQKNKFNFLILFIFSAFATLTDYSFLWVIASIYIILFIDSIRLLIQKKFTKKILFTHLLTLFFTLLPFVLWSPIFFTKIHSAVALESYIGQYLNTPIHMLIGECIEKMFFITTDDDMFKAIGIFVIIFNLFCLIQYLKSKNILTQKTYLFLLIISIVPIILSLIVSYTFFPIFLTRNIFVCSYSFYIFISIFISKISSNKINQFFLVFSFLILQIFTYHNTILNNFNFNNSIDILETRGVLSKNDFDKYPILFDYDLPVDSKSVWKYYLHCYDFESTCILKTIDIANLKPDDHFILIAYKEQPTIFKDISQNFRCDLLNYKISKNNNIKLFECQAHSFTK